MIWKIQNNPTKDLVDLYIDFGIPSSSNKQTGDIAMAGRKQIL